MGKSCNQDINDTRVKDLQGRLDFYPVHANGQIKSLQGIVGGI